MLEEKKLLYVLTDGSKRPVYLLKDTGVLQIESTFGSDAFKKEYNFFVEDYQRTPRILEYLRDKYHKVQADLYRKNVGFMGRLINKFLPYVPPIYVYGNFLDVGCNTASLLSKLPAQWNKFGVEISQEAYNVASRKQGVVVYNTGLETFESEVQFKFIRASHVIEHVTDYEGFLQKIHRLLDSDGYALLYTPNTKSISRYIFGKHWNSFYEKTHVNCFDLDNLANICSQNGFTVVEKGTYYMGTTSGSIVRFLNLDQGSRLGQIIFFTFFCLLYPFSLFVNALGLGGALYIYIKKR
jgi:2-polyprenyl-3-methyl-5-hydroxy-6-metoxy-1,4-benzoquinol methylase